MGTFGLQVLRRYLDSGLNSHRITAKKARLEMATTPSQNNELKHTQNTIMALRALITPAVSLRVRTVPLATRT
jgi:hypothetical protein